MVRTPGMDLFVARPIWSGTITFGLVNIPVKAYPAVRDHDVHFHQLQKRTGSRIRHRKVAEKSGKEVEPADIEMGFEVGKGRYVTFDKDELDELRPESTRAIEVSDFVALDEIDPIYYERTYWLVPADEPAKKGYQLLRAAMEERQRVGIGTVVMRNKQYLAAIRPLDGALAMSTMRFADEVVPRADVDDLPRRAKPEPKNLRMAVQLLDAMTSEWDPQALPRHVHRGAAPADQGQGRGQGDRRGAGAARAGGQGRRSHGRPRGERRRRQGQGAPDVTDRVRLVRSRASRRDLLVESFASANPAHFGGSADASVVSGASRHRAGA